MSRQELIWQARAHKCSSLSGSSEAAGVKQELEQETETANDENTVVDCVFISLPSFWIKRAASNATDAPIS